MLKKIIKFFFLDKIGSALNELNWSIIRFSPAPLKTFSQQKIMKGTMLWKLSGREDFFPTCFFAKDFLQLIFMSTSSVVTSGGLHIVAKSFFKPPHLNSAISREFFLKIQSKIEFFKTKILWNDKELRSILRLQKIFMPQLWSD